MVWLLGPSLNKPCLLVLLQGLTRPAALASPRIWFRL